MKGVKCRAMGDGCGTRYRGIVFIIVLDVVLVYVAVLRFEMGGRDAHSHTLVPPYHLCRCIRTGALSWLPTGFQDITVPYLGNIYSRSTSEGAGRMSHGSPSRIYSSIESIITKIKAYGHYSVWEGFTNGSESVTNCKHEKHNRYCLIFLSGIRNLLLPNVPKLERQTTS